MNNAGYVATNRQYDIEPKMQTNPNLQEYTDRGDNDRKNNSDYVHKVGSCFFSGVTGLFAFAAISNPAVDERPDRGHLTVVSPGTAYAVPLSEVIHRFNDTGTTSSADKEFRD